MTTATCEALSLTKNDVKAIRQADMVSFHRVGGENTLQLSKRVRDAGPFDDRERTHDIAVQATLRGYRGDDERPDMSGARCFAMIQTAQYCDRWQTVAKLVRTGDVLELEWTANDSNGYLRAALSNGAALSHDKMYLHICRDGRRALSFYLADSICPDNSARMIRY